MSERTGTAIGPLLDALGVRIRLNDDQHLVEAIVIGKVVDLTTDRCHGTSMVIGTSDGLDWIGQRGLLGAARDVLAADILQGEGD
jgi:hypothetical protein